MDNINSVGTPAHGPGKSRPGVRITAVLLLAVASALPGVGGAQTVAGLSSAHPSPGYGQEYTVLNTLGSATPRTTFSVIGSGGYAIFAQQFSGPPFTLARRSVLTQVGAFVNNCAQIVAGVPQCPNTLPFVVQIRRSVNGAPDPYLVVAAAPLTHDRDPLTVTFETASLATVTLEPGTYFAIFAPQQAIDSGFVLANAFGGYTARITPVGSVTPTGSTVDPANRIAVRILARPVKPKPHAAAAQ